MSRSSQSNKALHASASLGSALSGHSSSSSMLTAGGAASSQNLLLAPPQHHLYVFRPGCSEAVEGCDGSDLSLALWSFPIFPPLPNRASSSLHRHWSHTGHTSLLPLITLSCPCFYHFACAFLSSAWQCTHFSCWEQQIHSPRRPWPSGLYIFLCLLCCLLSFFASSTGSLTRVQMRSNELPEKMLSALCSIPMTRNQKLSMNDFISFRWTRRARRASWPATCPRSPTPSAQTSMSDSRDLAALRPPTRLPKCSPLHNLSNSLAYSLLSVAFRWVPLASAPLSSYSWCSL